MAPPAVARPSSRRCRKSAAPTASPRASWPCGATRLARGAEPLFIPTIGAAIRARRPWLSFQCPACQMIGEADLRTLDRHPAGSVESVTPHLSCPRCPNGPFVRLVALERVPAIVATRARG